MFAARRVLRIGLASTSTASKTVSDHARRTMASTSMRTITLSPTEERFADHLDRFASSLDPPVECRIAGGWVRDKLLDLPSNDLDIALSIPSGYSFALSFVDYLHAHDVKTGSVGRVAANPEQSKHLETGTTTILGLDCDFVGLRSETYTDSRIPDKVQLGTPLEDALRRDLTINSLFYNVHSRAVEDHTGSGLSDLERRIARTPLPPRQTFFDDPLRVLRCVRFAARFGLSIVDDVVEAIKDTEVQAALRTKVSRERVGIEVTKMLHHDPLHALTLIDKLGLHSSIFTAPAPIDPPRDDALKCALILKEVLQRFPGEETDALWLAAATAPFRGEVVKGKKNVPAVTVVVAEALKLSSKMTTSVTSLFDAAAMLDPKLEGRGELGVVLQHAAVRPWEQSIVWAVVMAVLPEWQGQWDGRAQAILEAFHILRDRVIALNLPADIDKPLLLDGKEQQALLALKPGPILAIVRNALNRWQLDHPAATKDEAEQWLKEMWEGDGRQEWEAMLPAKPDGKAEKRKR